MKVGVIAGVFDPIHKGHLRFIAESIEEYGLDKVFILIEEDSKHKKSFASFAHREKMVGLSIKNNPQVEVYPTQTASFPISSTLPKIKKEFAADFYLLIGNDVRGHISEWPGANELLQGVNLVVADRNSMDENKRISSGKVRGQIINGDQEIDMQGDALDYCRKNNLYAEVIRRVNGSQGASSVSHGSF